MVELFRVGFLAFTLADLFDVLVMTFVFYRFLLLVRGTRAAEMVMGVVVIMLLSFAALWLNMQGLSWLVRGGAFFVVIILVIVFQPELRDALAAIGRNRWTATLAAMFVRGRSDAAAVPIAEAAAELSRRGRGALVVVEGESGLRSVIDTGRELDAKLSSALLVTLFSFRSPLHDGAVVVRGETVVAAACMLPMTASPEYRDVPGMRHKAAIGVTEDKDALAVVVSEETGRISLAHRGKLYERYDGDSLKRELSGFMLKPGVWRPSAELAKEKARTR